ncbi:hypothetical protein CAL12_06455 [Bordetella genomosp. 8]|uniref:Uncharacterized protein n=1 Tax=Bordetella genomosp. 8 TaxID=1416806 RepID=A0A1W6YHJ1_9BORD|nr:hypothetical protein [Bordetella genomosp. 8]ARP80510.1 hypothetical protein CAL12_06455 [Bordetella genomosp. 8]
MTINTHPMTQAAMQATIESINPRNRHERFDAQVAWLNAHLAEEDIVFENFRGIDGRPIIPQWCANTFVGYLYKRPDAASAAATPPVYYSEKVAQAEASAVESMTVMLDQPFVDAKTKAMLQQSIRQLQANTQTSHCQEQMTRVLENARAAIIHRGLAQEPQCAETIHIIDAVLGNMSALDRPGMSAPDREFLGIYSETVKRPCEYAVANGRNPYPMTQAFFDACDGGRVAYDHAWDQALEAVRPQTRQMAEQLKSLLRPYAERPSQAAPEGAVSSPAQSPATRDRADSWQLV